MLSQLSYAPAVSPFLTTVVMTAVPDDSLIISHRFEFVNRFLKSFFKIFQKLSSAWLWSRGTLGNGVYYSISFSICQAVFEKKFEKFSKEFFVNFASSVATERRM